MTNPKRNNDPARPVRDKYNPKNRWHIYLNNEVAEKFRKLQKELKRKRGSDCMSFLVESEYERLKL